MRRKIRVPRRTRSSILFKFSSRVFSLAWANLDTGSSAHKIILGSALEMIEDHGGVIIAAAGNNGKVRALIFGQLVLTLLPPKRTHAFFSRCSSN